MICEEDLPPNSFLVNDNPHDVPCVFQIWVKKENERKLTTKVSPINYQFVKNTKRARVLNAKKGEYKRTREEKYCTGYKVDR